VPELVTLTEAAAHIGAGTSGSARRSLHRAGIRPVARAPGRAGESLYDAEQVRAWQASRPGVSGRPRCGRS
jgi:hypothetical protein